MGHARPPPKKGGGRAKNPSAKYRTILLGVVDIPLHECYISITDESRSDLQCRVQCRRCGDPDPNGFGCQPLLKAVRMGGFFDSKDLNTIVVVEAFRVLFTIVNPHPRMGDYVSKLQKPRSS